MTTPPKEFTTDGCSGLMSWFWRTVLRHPPPWEGDCVSHDKAYWSGGPPSKRLAADRNLAAAVAGRGYPVMAAVMYYAVRVGGHAYWPHGARWGYGYSWPKGYHVED